MHRISNIAFSLLLVNRFSTAAQSKYKFVCQSILIPHPQKLHKGGQDALFVSENCIAVADGVGGWVSQGVDSGKHSKNLMKILQRNLKNADLKEPKSLFVQSVHQNKERGSTTFSLLTLNNNILRYAYMGDSIFFLARNKNIILEVPITQNYPNCPLQVGEQGNDPNLAATGQVQVQLGDVLLLASDGVWDNVPKQKLLQILTKQTNRAKAIGQYAHSQGKKPLNWSASNRSGIGGKLDDIAVVVADIKAI